MKLIIATIIVLLITLIGCAPIPYYHQTDILQIKISPSGKYLVTVNGNQLTVWDSSTLKQIYTKDINKIFFADFVSENKIVVANNKDISILDYTSDKIINNLNRSSIQEVRLSNNQDLLLYQTFSSKYEASVTAVSLPDLKYVFGKRFKSTYGGGGCYVNPINSEVVVIQNRLGILTDNATLQFWEFNGRDPINNVSIDVSEIGMLRISSDGEKIYCGTSDGIKVLRFGDGLLLYELATDSDCRKIELSPDEKYITTQDKYGYEGTFLWRPNDGGLELILEFNSPFCFSPDGYKIYAAIGSGIKIYNIK